jgi:ABC-2 type transport system permease protein
MIATILRIGWISLRRDRVAQAMSFLLPLIFFSIFAMVFGGQRKGAPQVTLVVVDDDRTDASRRLVAALEAEKVLRVWTTQRQTHEPFDRRAAEGLVRAGDAPVALVIPAGVAAAFGYQGAAAGPKLALLADVSDPLASQIVQGLLQKVLMTSTPGAPAQGEAERFTSSPFEIVDVMKSRGGVDLISFYAAGTAVMFLLFSCSAGAGTLLDEVDSGTLERVLTSRLGMTGLLIGKWLFLSAQGFLQIVVMFVWGALVFKLRLLEHVPGFLAMTLVTATAAAGFGLVLATAAPTRAQLGGLSTIVILVMSAVGGSMFPRFLMSATMQKAGLLTFNAWALDGYIKVFWRNEPVVALWPQLAVLAALTVVFLGIARLLARRWETV